jgi:hypothetical protein
MFHCAAKQKVSTVGTYPFEILFGSTGGFTNINPVFEVRSTGEVLKKDNSSSNPYPLKRIDKRTLDTLFMLLRECNFPNLNIKQISNYTNYIEIKSEKFNNKVMWFNDSQIPPELKKLYETLINTIKN